MASDIYKNVCIFYCGVYLGFLVDKILGVCDPPNIKYIILPILRRYREACASIRSVDKCMFTIGHMTDATVRVTTSGRSSTDIAIFITGECCSMGIQLHTGVDRLFRITSMTMGHVYALNSSGIIPAKYLPLYNLLRRFTRSKSECSEFLRTMSHVMFRSNQMHSQVVIAKCPIVIEALKLSKRKMRINYVTVYDLYMMKKTYISARKHTSESGRGSPVPVPNEASHMTQYRQWRHTQYDKPTRKKQTFAKYMDFMEYLILHPSPYEYASTRSMLPSKVGDVRSYYPGDKDACVDEVVRLEDLRDVCCDIVVVTGDGDVKVGVDDDDEQIIDIARLFRRNHSGMLSRSCLILIPNISTVATMMKIHLLRKHGYRYGVLSANVKQQDAVAANKDTLALFVDCMDEIQRATHSMYNKYDATRPITSLDSARDNIAKLFI